MAILGLGKEIQARYKVLKYIYMCVYIYVLKYIFIHICIFIPIYLWIDIGYPHYAHISYVYYGYPRSIHKYIGNTQDI